MAAEQLDVDDGPVGDAAMTIKWRLLNHLMVFLEIDTGAVEAEIPPNFTIVEPRPGIALLCIGVLQYRPGNFGPRSPIFHEVFSVVSVYPDLSIPMPTPRFSFYPISVYSDSPDFCRTEAEVLHTPTYLVPSLDVQWSDDRSSVSVRDKRGPIIEVRNTHRAPTFKRQVIWGQHFNQTKGGCIVNERWTGGILLKGPWEWDGWVWEHQRDDEWGSVHPHHFFGNADVSCVRGLYRMLLAQPGAEHIERFYVMSPMY